MIGKPEWEQPGLWWDPMESPRRQYLLKVLEYAPEGGGLRRTINKMLIELMLDEAETRHVPWDGPIKWHPTTEGTK